MIQPAYQRLTVEATEGERVARPEDDGGNGANRESLHGLLARGGATLGLAACIERGAGFVANLLAARLAGPHTYGAYSLVLATAGTVAAYAGAGIGATANRFSGQYRREGGGYRSFLHALLIVGFGSALVAAGLMLLGAGPLARAVLRNESLTPLLRLAAILAGAMILLECVRGLLVGQRKFAALLLLSLIVGPGLLLILPGAARLGAGAMIVGQGCIALLAVLACAVLARRLGLTPRRSTERETAGPGVRSIFSFGLVQLSAVFGINIASWWIALLLVRGDATLAQMGVYAIASQFRNLASMGPGLLLQTSYPLLTEEAGREYGGPNRVMLINTFLTTSLTVAVAGLVIASLPWVIRLLYGSAYAAGEIPAALLLATSIVHMGAAPTSHRLSIVALRFVAIINSAWALIMVVAGIFLIPARGASGAAAAWLVAHIFSQILGLVALKRSGNLVAGMLKISTLATTGVFVFVSLAYLRAARPAYNVSLTALLLMALLLLLCFLVGLGLRNDWLPRNLSRKFPGERFRTAGRSQN
ncbi:MAG TPA: oligosaccharide flippase family protein [Pyrinomonadaceae bacterium]|jgi:O-antigen/teichoic acid export membrane protein|nr:oligosaccharide flippase family protein [Pyrinomonadaceae bacterium]